MKKTQYFILVLTALFLISCGSLNNTGKQKVQYISLDNTSWQLAESVQGKIPTLLIGKGKITGNAGCNNYFSNVITNTQTGYFFAEAVSTTRKACRNMQGEQSFLQMLKKANRYKVENNILKLYQNKILLLKFVKK